MFYPVAEILDEILDKVRAGGPIDYITFAGSGEPTLYSGLGELISRLKAATSVPVAVITNGSLFSDPMVRAEVGRADMVIPSLDAAGIAAFEKVNRPAPGLDFQQMVNGLIAFRTEFQGTLWLELFLVEEAVATDADINALALLVSRIAPEKIQINTPVRPVAESSVRPLPRETLQRIVDILGEKAEIVADFPSKTQTTETRSVTPQDVLALIARHPCTADEIALGLAASPDQIRKHLDALIADGAARESQTPTGCCYTTI
jgi:wyosine [tRNA(Phe)-imidazoG37] synthetase (radical SAM superfamily)